MAYGPEQIAVRDVSFTVENRELLVLLGSSGCGKTTLLKLVNRLLDPTRGAIHLGREDVQSIPPTQLRRRIGYVFQGIGLFPHMTVGDNVGLVPRLLRWDDARREERIETMLQLTGLTPATYRDRYPSELSGGQQQRVGVARALAGDPEYLLMDEPFGALDALTRNHLQNELLNLKKKLKKTILFVTHDILEALTLGDRIAVMRAGQLEQVGSPQEILHNPRTPFVEELIRRPAEQLRTLEELFQSRD